MTNGIAAAAEQNMNWPDVVGLTLGLLVIFGFFGVIIWLILRR